MGKVFVVRMETIREISYRNSNTLYVKVIKQKRPKFLKIIVFTSFVSDFPWEDAPFFVGCNSKLNVFYLN